MKRLKSQCHTLGGSEDGRVQVRENLRGCRYCQKRCISECQIHLDPDLDTSISPRDSETDLGLVGLCGVVTTSPVRIFDEDERQGDYICTVNSLDVEIHIFIHMCHDRKKRKM